MSRRVAALVLALLWTPLVRAADVPRVGVTRLVIGLPIYRPGDDGAAAQPLSVYLTQTLGVPVEVRMAEPYEELPKLLRQGQVDIAQIAPLAYVRVKTEEPRIKGLATAVISGNPTYLGHFYVRKESDYRSLADLRGTRMGYVKPQSTSGYLFARDLLRRKGFDPDTFFKSTQFIGSHPGVIAAVLAGDIDVGAAEDITSDWIGKENIPEGLRVIAKTERIPNDCIAARPGLDDGTIRRVTSALLDLHPADKRASAILDALNINGWIAGDEARYDRVRRVLAADGAKTP
jgi:phosphate/phosphite/phosphonate ABC transporter binding protein